MAKKKTSKKKVQEEQHPMEQAHEEPHPMEEPPTYGSFPKIASEGIIKQCTLKKDGPDIRFDNLSISSDQAGIILGLIEGGDKVRVTIECIQGNLPFDE